MPPSAPASPTPTPTTNPYSQIPVEKCEPNPWNPNKLSAEYQIKLENGIRQVLQQSGSIPPITVRKHPTKKGFYQIIDGYHRWLILKKLKQTHVDAFVLTVDDSMARVLTAMLNYVRGEADLEKYPILIAEALAAREGLTFQDLANLLPENADLLEELVQSSSDAVDILERVMEERGMEDDAEEPPERWVNLNFSVPLEVAGILEKELDRIADHLSGKNRRIRALEYMAINSALTPLDNVVTQITEKESKRLEDGEEDVPKDAGFKSDVEKELKKSASKRKPRASASED